MTYDEALEIGRKAFQEARRLHGMDRAKIYEEVRRRAQQDAKLMEAIGMTGTLTLSANQATKH